MKPVCTRITIIVAVLVVVVLSGAEADARNNLLGLQNAWILAPPTEGDWDTAVELNG